MAQKAFVNGITFTLPEACTREQAGELHSLLSRRLTQLICTVPLPERAALDLSAVAALDPCGCQLLILLMEQLRRHGITPVPYGLSEEVADHVALLGFSEGFPVPSRAPRR